VESTLEPGSAVAGLAAKRGSVGLLPGELRTKGEAAIMAVPDKLKGRYEIKEVLGQGGMGLVFRAWDTTVKRDVALKTLRDAPTRAALQMFYKECEVLAAMSHPNIVEIFDIGEFEDEGKSKPYFVMPLLPGAPLDRLIKTASHRLTVERVVDIVCQACRGLQAAHERGLVHRDIKPSNLFVMDDDSVKIIDFGVAHMAESGLSIGAKGTLLYMAPEQLQMKPATPASDVYSLGVSSYEALTRRRPFDGVKEAEIVESIMHSVPPPVSDLNPACNQTLSRVIHKALAKQPWNRYASAKEFSDTLLKGLRNEAIEFFSPERLQPRIERATKAFEQGDLQFATEILSEIEAEGHIDPAIGPLKQQIEAAGKQKTIGQLLESARTRFEQNEHPLALQKIQEILQLDPGNAPALGLKASIENKATAAKIDEWLRLANQHIGNQAWSHAREALHNVLQLKADEPRGMQLLADVDRKEQDFIRLRKEKEELYSSALAAWNSGEVTSALSKMEKVVDLDHKAPETSAPERAASYQTFYNKVRSEHESIKNSYAEAKKLLDDRNFAQARAIADEWLGKYPGHALFQALKFDIEEQQRQVFSARIAEIDRQVEEEPDLERRVSIIEQAVADFPGEAHFERQLRPMREKRDLVNSIAAKARYHEERAQWAEALAQWEILGTIYSQYPGLGFEVERVTKKKQQQALSEAKSHWTTQIDAAMSAGAYSRALEIEAQAEAEFPNDPELAQLKALATQRAGRAAEAATLLAQGQSLVRQNAFDEGLEAMRQALKLDPQNGAIRVAIAGALVERAQGLVETDWRAAEPLIQQALEIDPAHVLARNLRIVAQDHKRDEAVNSCFTQARQFRAAGNFESALAEAEKCLAAYPLDPRLAQLRDILIKERDEARRAAGWQAPAPPMRAASPSASGAPVAAPPMAPPVVGGDIPTVATAHPLDGPPPPASAIFAIPTMPAPPAESVCPSCGARNPADARFCEECGQGMEAPAAAPPAPAAAAGTLCPVCGTENVADAIFCTGCGGTLSRAVPPAPPIFAPVEAAPPVVETPQATVFCMACGAPNEAGALFCTGCGGTLSQAAPEAPPAEPIFAPVEAAPPPLETPQATVFCMACGAQNEAGAVFCTGCGGNLGVAAPPPTGVSGLPPAAAPPAPPAAAPPAKPPGRRKTLVASLAAGGAVLLVVLGVILLLPKLRTAPPPGQLARVEVRTWPPGATIIVNGKIRGTSNFQLEDKPGAYQIDATLEGYQPASAQVQLKLGAKAPVELTLQPLPETVRLVTDFNDGKAVLDDQPPRDQQDGQVTFDAVPPGKHGLKLTSRLGQAEIQFELTPGAVPVLDSLPVVKNTAALVVGSFGNRARVYTTLLPAKVSLDGTPVGDATADGLQLTNVSAGSHELLVSDGKTQLKKVVDVGAAPLLAAYFQSDRNIGTIVVLTGEDGVEVYIDGKKERRQTSRGGQLRVQREPKEYRVRVVKPGFENVPEQTVRIAKGEEKKLTFKMVPLPTTAHLTLQGVPGAQVFIDQNAVGTVLPDGTFQISNLAPGEHTIELRKDRQRSRTVRRAFVAGQTVNLAENEVALRGGPGTLRVVVTPANATVTVMRSGHPPQTLSGSTIELDEGPYTVTARAAGHLERSEQVEVTGGQIVTATLTLPREERRATAMGMEGWQQPGGWKEEAGWQVRHGGGMVLYGVTGKPGVYEFTLMAASGGLLRGKAIQWFINYTDPKNYVLYRMDKDTLRRIQVVNGKRTELARKNHGLAMKEMMATLRVDVSPGLVVVSALNNGKWVTLDSWAESGGNLTAGRFGILIEGKDEMRLSGFRFVPKE
jgi:serine/threonine protein kinase/ribosomal protein L40E